MSEEDVERKVKKALLRKTVKHLLVRLFILFLLSAIGGFIFRWAEGSRELEYKCGVKKVRRDFIDSLWQGSKFMKEEDWKSVARRRLFKFEDELHNAYDDGMDANSGTKTWNFLNSVFYSMTIMTTIGYGHISPVSFLGKMFTILYALIGIPVFSIVMADAGKVLTLAIKLLLTRSEESRKDYSVDEEFNLSLKPAMIILVLYSLVGTVIFYLIESEWGLLGSFYFVFITSSTVGFGDLVPNSPLMAILSSVYFLFGLALTSLVLGVIQERLEAPLNSLTRRFSFLMGLTDPLPVAPSESTEEDDHLKSE